MTPQELEQIAGKKLSDAQLIAEYLDSNCSLRHSTEEVAEQIEECLRALNLKRVGPR